jgi:hypothetical protein
MQGGGCGWELEVGPTQCVVTAASAVMAGTLVEGLVLLLPLASFPLIDPTDLPSPPRLQGAISCLLLGVLLLLPMACLVLNVTTDLPSPHTLQGAINCWLLGVPLFPGPVKMAVMLVLVLGCLLRGRAVSGHCVV